MTGIRVASPIINLHGVISTLIGIGGSTVTTIAMGKRDRETADASFTLTIVLGVASGLVFALVVAPLADTIARLISSSEETVPYTARVRAARRPVPPRGDGRRPVCVVRP